MREKLLTDNREKAITRFKVKLAGKDSTAEVVSRSVARGDSYQSFISDMIGKNRSFGHVECDSILLDNARILSTPRIDAVSPEASLVHEAAVGKIAGEQLTKTDDPGSYGKRGGRHHYKGLSGIALLCLHRRLQSVAALPIPVQNEKADNSAFSYPHTAYIVYPTT